MSQPPTQIDSFNRLTLPPHAVREIASRPLELASHSGRHLLFTVPAEEGAVVMAGVLGEVSVTDLLSFFNMFRKSGVLRFQLPGGEKNLFFQQGEIISATSTFPEEDIGEVLFGLGKIDRETLQKMRPFLAEPAAIGRVLVERDAIGAQDLWLALRQQVESIVYHLFTFQGGSFSFLHQAVDQEEVRLSMSTQNLIMEGLRRVDERALFLRRIPSQDLLPVLTGKTAAGETTAVQKLLELIAERRHDVREVIRRSGLGEFDGLRLLHHLVEKGIVVLEEAPAAPAFEGELGEVLGIFNGALTVLHRQITDRNPHFRQEMQIFLRDLPQPFSYVFREVGLKEDGTVDGGRILANLAGLEEGDKKKLLADGLSELIYMECHIARRDLGVTGSAALVQRVQEVSRRVKALNGRTE
jgi:hypothetical protein